MANKIEQSFYSVYSYSGIESIEHAFSVFESYVRKSKSGNLGMTSSYLKTFVFARPHDPNAIHLLFRKSPPWREYLKTSVFKNTRLRVDGVKI